MHLLLLSTRELFKHDIWGSHNGGSSGTEGYVGNMWVSDSADPDYGFLEIWEILITAHAVLVAVSLLNLKNRQQDRILAPVSRAKDFLSQRSLQRPMRPCYI